MSGHRHCERSEAIHLAAQRKNGLLRFARNDVEKPVPGTTIGGHFRVQLVRDYRRLGRIPVLPLHKSAAPHLDHAAAMR
jgi:hypothetical protein